MVMKKTFWTAAVLAMLVIWYSYSTDSGFSTFTGFSTAALGMAGVDVKPGDTSSFAVGMITQYLIVVAVFYVFMRSIMKSFTS